jgi:hypothetical protein
VSNSIYFLLGVMSTRDYDQNASEVINFVNISMYRDWIMSEIGGNFNEKRRVTSTQKASNDKNSHITFPSEASTVTSPPIDKVSDAQTLSTRASREGKSALNTLSQLSSLATMSTTENSTSSLITSSSSSSSPSPSTLLGEKLKNVNATSYEGKTSLLVGDNQVEKVLISSEYPPVYVIGGVCIASILVLLIIFGILGSIKPASHH